MRLAFLTSLVPTGRPDTGFEIANEGALDSLKAAGATVTVFGFKRPADRPDASRDIVVLANIDIETAKASVGSKLSWLAASVRHGLPLSAAKLRCITEAALIGRIEHEGPFDGVVVNTAQMAAAFPGVLKRWPSILVAHNVEHLSARENALSAGGALRIAYQREARLLEHIERAAIDAARHIFFLSEDDRRLMMPSSASSSVLALLTPEPKAGHATEPLHDVGLIGTWTWRPNRVGLDWFLQAVAPLLPAHISIAIAGRLPPDLAASAGDVRLVGPVPDASAFVRSCRVMALSSRIGTGVQLKTIELMRLGRPAVATASSLRGIAYRPENMRVCDDPKAFASALAELVGAARAGSIGPISGEPFVEAQKQAMQTAIDKGIKALRPKR